MQVMQLTVVINLIDNIYYYAMGIPACFTGKSSSMATTFQLQSKQTDINFLLQFKSNRKLIHHLTLPESGRTSRSASNIFSNGSCNIPILLFCFRKIDMNQGKNYLPDELKHTSKPMQLNIFLPFVVQMDKETHPMQSPLLLFVELSAKHR